MSSGRKALRFELCVEGSMMRRWCGGRTPSSLPEVWNMDTWHVFCVHVFIRYLKYLV